MRGFIRCLVACGVFTDMNVLYGYYVFVSALKSVLMMCLCLYFTAFHCLMKCYI